MLDLRITGGTVIDGSGAPRRRADIGVREGRVVAIGEIDEPARETIAVRDRVVAPGFVDLHTHFDAQAFWDPTLSPSPLHGVTTVIGGNCGFSIAPLMPDAGDYLMRMLARVEGMPLEALQQGVPWNWRSFGEYLDRLENRLAVNAGFLVGHSALRRVVMSEAAVGEPATAAQIDAMVGLLRASLAEGGLGFSSSYAPTHNDGDGKPVPSRHATREEILALAATVRDFEGTTLEFLPAVGIFDPAHVDLMASMSIAANRPLNWNVLQINSVAADMAHRQLEASDYARERGGRVVALTLPQVMTLRLNFVSGFVLDTLPGWPEIFGKPMAERKLLLADPSVRQRLNEQANSDAAGLFRFFAWWDNYVVDETFSEGNHRYRGRTIGDIAAELGRPPFDTMLDLALADDLRTSFRPQMPGDDDESWRLRAEVWRDPRTVIGASDAGAHLDMIDTFTCTTSLLGPAVRDRGLLSLEEAIHQLTEIPARLYGIRDRGRLALGCHADIVIFDPERIGPRPVHTRHDLPAGAARLYAEADGIDHVLVNGVEIVRHGEMTTARPGTILRSGRDTETVTP